MIDAFHFPKKGSREKQGGNVMNSNFYALKSLFILYLGCIFFFLVFSDAAVGLGGGEDLAEEGRWRREKVLIATPRNP